MCSRFSRCSRLGVTSPSIPIPLACRADPGEQAKGCPHGPAQTQLRGTALLATQVGPAYRGEDYGNE
jgi:hypothetical protein